MADHRIWDEYLTEQDRAHIELHPAPRRGTGRKPALLLVDLYRSVFGDEPEPLLDAVKRWPDSCGLAAWDALPHLEHLLLAARDAAIPVIHVAGLDAMPGWRPLRGSEAMYESQDARERFRRRYEIIDELAPLAHEVVLRKVAPSAFAGTPLVGLLVSLRVDTLIVAGESTSGCVRATVVDGCSYRFNMVVVEECVFDRHQATHAINLFDMDQKYADVMRLDEVISYMQTSPPALRGSDAHDAQVAT